MNDAKVSLPGLPLSPLGTGLELDMPDLKFIGESDGGALELRGECADAAFISAVRDAIGSALPGANRAITTGDLHVLWQRPTGWLLNGPRQDVERLRERLEDELRGRHACVLDVSGTYVTLQLLGRRARELLGRGCSLDLHPRVFGPGHCAQTILADVPLMIQHREAVTGYRLYVDYSLAHYCADWLRDAAAGLEPA